MRTTTRQCFDSFRAASLATRPPRECATRWSGRGHYDLVLSRGITGHVGGNRHVAPAAALERDEVPELHREARAATVILTVVVTTVRAAHLANVTRHAFPRGAAGTLASSG